MTASGVVVGAIAASGTILATLAYCLWNEERSEVYEEEVAAPPPTDMKTPDEEECYDHEMRLVVESLPKDEALEFGRLFDAVGSLIVSCPSDEGTKRLSDIMMIGIFCRNRLWGLSNLVEYAKATMGLQWAEAEMKYVIQRFGASQEWVDTGLSIAVQYFAMLQKTEHELKVRKVA